jgi:hypothetical protein
MYRVITNDDDDANEFANENDAYRYANERIRDDDAKFIRVYFDDIFVAYISRNVTRRANDDASRYANRFARIYT